MRLPSAWAWTGLATLLAFALGASWAFGSPPTYVHPDEQSAALPAMDLAGVRPPLPEALRGQAGLFVPYNVLLHEGGAGVSTGFLASSGMGFAYPVLLAPLHLLGAWGPYLLGALSVALLYLGALLVLDPRRPTSFPLAAIVVAIPPVAVQASMLFSNLPGLALAVLGLGLAAEAARRGRPLLLAAGMLALGLAAAIRFDYLIAFAAAVPLAGAAFVASRPRGRARAALGWAGAVLLCLALAALAFRVLNGSWGLPYAHVDPDAHGVRSEGLRGVWERWTFALLVAGEHRSEAVGEATAQGYLFGFVPALMALGLLHLLRPSRRSAPGWLLLPLAAQGLAVWLFAASLSNHYGLGCSCVDSSYARYFLPLYAALALLGALALQAFAERLPGPRLRMAAAAAVAALVVVPGVAHAHEGDHGVGWVRDMKEFHDLYEQAARSLPPEAVVSGNYLSKIVHARPVLVPERALDKYAQAVTNVTAAGHPVFVDVGWLVPGKDGRGDFGQQLMRSGRHYLVHSGVKDYYEVKVTNATVRQVFDLFPGDWEPAQEGSALQAVRDAAHFRAVDRPDGSLPQHGLTERAARVAVTWLDDEPGRVVRAGYVNFDSNSTVELAAWAGTGSGAWVTREFTVQKGLVVTGALYLTGGPLVKRLEVTWP